MNFWMWCVTAYAGLVLAAAATENVTSLENIGDAENMETFEKFEKKMKDGANNLVRRILPFLMKGAGSSNISGPCMSSIMRIIGGVRQLREWALRFVDACGKLPPGILEGTSLSLGDYDQCLGIEVGKKQTPPQTPEDLLFTGKYCLLENHRPEVIMRAIRDYESGNKEAPIAKTKTVLNLFVRYKHLTNTSFKLGICIPSKCSENDLQEIFNSESLQALGKIKVAYCEGKDRNPRTTTQDVILGILGFIGGCLLLGTALDVYMRMKEGQKNSKFTAEKKSAFKHLIESVSLYSNAVELTDMEQKNEPLRVLCALRTITVMLTIYSHTYGHIHELHFQKFSKPANFLKFFESFTFSGIANGSVGMDTVVFIAGVMITYRRWRYLVGNESAKLKIGSLLLQRYFRMSAAQLLIICLFFLVPLIGDGPLWTAYMDKQLKNCEERWWLNFLYIANFWSARQTCVYHTWILAVIMQLTILSAVFLWLMKWSPKAGTIFSLFLILAGVIGVGVVNIILELPGSMAFYMLDIRTGPLAWRRVYSLAYDHVGPFCIGLLTGYYLGRNKDTLNLSRARCTLLWCLSIICTSSVLFGLYEYRHGEKISLSLATFYAVAHRNVWALGIAWLVIACSTGNGGAATKVLKAKIFVPLDKMCYMAFMLHIPIMFYHSGIIRERWFMGHFELMFFAAGYITMSFVGSFVIYVAFVRPYYYLESVVSSWAGSRNKLAFQRKIRGPPVTSTFSGSVLPELFMESNGCVNLGYSKKPDGV